MTKYDGLKWLICIVLAVATLAVFWPVKDHAFINMDDYQYVTENPHVKTGINVRNIRWAFTTFYASNWHPLTWLSLMLDHRLFGLNPMGYHLINLLFHITNSILLFLILRRTADALWPSAFVAALFALHPLHVESVAWVAERKDVLSTFFWLLTMGAYVFYVERPDRKRYFLTLVFFTLGLLSKPMLVTLPVVLLLFDYWPLGRMKFREAMPPRNATRAKAKKPGVKKTKSTPANSGQTGLSGQAPLWPIVRSLLREKIPFFILSAASCIVTVIAQQRGGALMSSDVLPFGVRLVHALVSYVGYIEKMICPINLAIFYPHHGMPPVWTILFSAAFLSVLTFVVIRWGKQMPYLPVGWFWYLGTMIPVIGIVQVGGQSMADRYTYVPLIGLFIDIAWMVPVLAGKWRFRPSVLAAGAGVVLSIFVFLDWSQVRYWRDSITLFEHAVQVVPDNHRAHNNLGVALSASGRSEEAANHYAEAIRIKPGYENAHFNLGNFLAARGRSEEALTHYSEAIRLKPNYAKAHQNMGTLLASTGNFKEAIDHYQEALKSDPANAGIYYNLGVAWMAANRPNEAIECLQEAVRIQPGFVEAHNDLGMALARLGDMEGAREQFQEALRLRPSYEPARYNLQAVTRTHR